MKITFRLMLIAAMVCGFSLAVISCKDDDNDNGDKKATEQPTDAMDDDGATAVWRLLCALTDADSLAANWQSLKYKPTIGAASTTEPLARMVQVNDLDDAKMHFGSMTDMTPNEIGQTATVSVDGMGTLTWKQAAEGDKYIATVDVKLKQIPHLQRIYYQMASQSENNAATFGTAYYRLGDVVVDKDGYFWVCVRPAFSGKKDKSYWMNIINAAETGRDPETGKLPGYPEKNLYDYSFRYHANVIHLPTGLAYEHRMIYELSNFIWALLDPAKYHTLVGEGEGLGGLDYTYHGEKFLRNVAYYWDQNGIWEKLFNRSHQEMLGCINPAGKINFFYYGKNWKVGSTARLWKYTSRGYEVDYNRKQSQDEVLYEMKAEKTGFDILRAAQDPTAASEKDCPEPRPDDALTGTWVIRMKKGSDLATISYSPTSDLGVRPLYRYNASTVPVTVTGSNLQTEDDVNDLAAGASPFTGESYYHTGDVLTDEKGHHWIVTYPAGMDYDRSPYSELVSFDALELAGNGAYATNASKLKEVLRGYSFLWGIAHNSYGKTYSHKVIPEDESGSYCTILRNMMKARVDPRFMFQILAHEDGARNDTEQCTLPYRVDGDTKQRLLRFLLTSDTGNKDMIFNYWQHYPSVPSDQEKHQQTFSNTLIYLQDVADQNMVNTYGKDYYATRPFTDFGKTDKTPRKYRTQADAIANKFSNYVYDYQKWYDATYATDMWNEPVASVVFDAVLDRGTKNHETVSVKGRKLTRWKPVPFAAESDYFTISSMDESAIWGVLLTLFNDTFMIDGKTIPLPTYTEVWFNNDKLE